MVGDGRDRRWGFSVIAVSRDLSVSHRVIDHVWGISHSDTLYRTLLPDNHGYESNIPITAVE